MYQNSYVIYIYTFFRRKKAPQLSVVSVQSTSIPPKEMVTYTKQTQTAHTTHERDGKQYQYLALFKF